MVAYPTAPLREVCETVEYGYTASSTQEPVGPKFLRITDIVPDLLDWESVPYCEIDPKKLAKHRLRTGDIVIARTGATTGWAKYINNPPESVFASYLVRIRPKPTVDARYVGFVIESPVYKEFIQQHMGGAAQPNANAQVLTSFEIPLPPVSVQQRIAGILSAYDRLIESCQRRIKILESMARALYREWFVNFRFPGHENHQLVASPLGRIPEGWEVKTLGQIAENFDRLRKPLSKMKRAEIQGEYPYYGAAKVFDYINDYIFDGEYLLMAEDGSVITTERAPVLQLVNEKFWPNNHTHVLRGMPPYSTHFLYLGLSEIDVSPYITGAAQPKITQENMNRIPFLCGSAKLHDDFNRIVESTIRQTQLLQRQIQNLRHTRDLLLPRLLSGQIELSGDLTAEAIEVPQAAGLDQCDPTPVDTRGAVGNPQQQFKRRSSRDQRRPASEPDSLELIHVVRKVFSESSAGTHEWGIQRISWELGHKRVGSRIREMVAGAIATAVKRGILTKVGYEYRLSFRAVDECTPGYLDASFQKAVGRSWIEREDAIRAFSYFLGYARTGPTIEACAQSVIERLIRHGELVSDQSGRIRRA